MQHERVLPQPSLAPFIEHFWSVRWDLRSPFVAETLPHPSVHLLLEVSNGETRAELSGVPSGRFVRSLEGRGRVFGTKFRPAAFQPVLGAPLSTLTDRVLPSRDVLGPAYAGLIDALSASLDDPSLAPAMALTEAYLTRILPEMPPEVTRLRDLVERLASDRSLTKVEDAAALISLDVRTLQRRFSKYVGVSPKWVIQRYRLHEAAVQLAQPAGPSLAALAASLGYFDQSHFIRDFKAVVGHPPSHYRR